MKDSVPFLDLAAQQREVQSAIDADLKAVFSATAFVGGPAVAEFEQEYAAFVGARYCIGVANGTDAVELALRAAGVGPGDEVILPANTFVATAEAVVRAGATPVLADVDETFLLIDPESVERAITKRTRAVIPVHLYGQMAPVEKLAAAVGPTISIIEDAAQSQGATRHGVASGAFGLAGATSFYPGKNLGAAGDAGAVTTDDRALADRVRLLGAHGSQKKYIHGTLGFNSRLDTIQAVVLLHKLTRLQKWNALRQAAASTYEELLSAEDRVLTPTIMEGNSHVWHLYVVRVPARDDVLARLHTAGVGAALHYPTPIHLTGAFAALGWGRGTFPAAERAADEILSLPMFPHLVSHQQERVCEALRDALR